MGEIPHKWFISGILKKKKVKISLSTQNLKTITHEILTLMYNHI